jgi:DNA-binding NarL/FixJ family response regulator
MSISISSALTTLSSAEAAGAYSNPARPVQQSTSAAADTVQLSESQQVYQLYNQGQTVSQIASSLSLAVETVNSYLGISAAKS